MLDGAPLEAARIEFRPIAPTERPVAGGQFTGGRYEVPAALQGLKSGSIYRIEVSSVVGSSKFDTNPSEPSGKREVLENIIPERYKEKSDLKVTIEDDPTRNVFDFALTRN